MSKPELKQEEDACARSKCLKQDCAPAQADPNAVAACQAGRCALESAKDAGVPQGSECRTAAECVVWCCPADLASFPRGKKPRPGCKRCPAPIPAAECLDGRCAVAPRALPK